MFLNKVISISIKFEDSEAFEVYLSLDGVKANQ